MRFKLVQFIAPVGALPVLALYETRQRVGGELSNVNRLTFIMMSRDIFVWHWKLKLFVSFVREYCRARVLSNSSMNEVNVFSNIIFV